MTDPSRPAPLIALPADPPRDFRGEWTVDEVRRGAFSEHAGILRSLPVAVAVPEDASDVAALVRWAAEHGIALVPRAAGTGMPGGNIGPGIAVDLKTRFGTIDPVDADRQTARVQPGATLGDLNRAAAPHGLQFPVDP